MDLKAFVGVKIVPLALLVAFGQFILCMLSVATPIMAQGTSTPSPHAPAFGPVPSSVAPISKTITPTILKPGQEAVVTVTLNTKPLPECIGIPGKPLDAVFVIDNSASAFSADSLWIDPAKAAAMRMIRESLVSPVYVDREQAVPSQAGIVTSGLVGTTLQTALVPLTTDYKTVLAEVERLGIGTDTVLEDSVPKVLEAFQARRPEAIPALFIVLHDNGAFTNVGFAAVQKVRDAGIQVYVIAAADRAEIDPDQTIALTGNATGVFYETDSLSLRQLFVLASGGEVFGSTEGGFSGRDVQITEEISPPDLAQVVEVLDGGGVGADGRVTWTLRRDIPRDESIVLRYRVRTLSDGELTLRSWGAYIDCNGFLHTGVDNAPFTERQIWIEQPTVLPEVTAPPADETPDNSIESTTTEVPIGGGRIVIRGPDCVVIVPLLEVPTPCWLAALLLCLLPLLLLGLLWWLLSHRGKSNPRIPQPSPRLRPAHRPPKIDLPTPKPLAGDVILPGAQGDDQALVDELAAAASIRGRIKSGKRGVGRLARVNAQVFTDGEALVHALALSDRGQFFYWQKPEGQEVEISVGTLAKGLRTATSPKRPVLAAWGLEPTDNHSILIELKPDPAIPARMNATIKSEHHKSSMSTADTILSYHLVTLVFPGEVGIITVLAQET